MPPMYAVYLLLGGLAFALYGLVYLAERVAARTDSQEASANASMVAIGLTLPFFLMVPVATAMHGLAFAAPAW